MAQEDQRKVAMELFFAASEGNAEQCKALLESRVDPDFRDYQQRCPLHVAAGFGHFEVIQLLIDHKADVNAVGSSGQAPLDEAQAGGHVNAEQLLKAHGASLQKMFEVRLQKKAARQKFEVRRADIELCEELAHTLKSTVHRALWNGVEVVAKMVGTKEVSPEDSEASTATSAEDLKHMEADLEEEILNEIALLKTIRHPDLVMFIGCCLEARPIMLISEYMPGGDLERYYASMQQHGRPWAPKMKVVNCWGRSILRALHFLHTCHRQIIHRDLKPMNILLTKKLEVKISDFGISKTIGRSESGRILRSQDEYVMTGGIGSFRYMAPEVARHEMYTEKVDIYAFGLILYFMSCGRRPFYYYEDTLQVLKDFKNGKEPRPDVSECPKAFRAIMKEAWAVEAENRPSASELGERLVECSSARNILSCRAMCKAVSNFFVEDM